MALNTFAAFSISFIGMSLGSGKSGMKGSNLHAEFPSSSSFTAVCPACSGLSRNPPLGVGMYAYARSLW